jgi:adenylate cyclase
VFCAFSAALFGIWILMAVPLAIAVVTVTLCFAYQYQLEGRQHRFLRHAFKHYVSSAVIDQLVENPASLAIGGERRELTIFFSDIAGFTTISETIEPAKLVRLLNMFLSEMAAIIMQSGGTVDKYVGDAIVAFWNAPLPVPDHAQRGVRAALACQRRLTELAPIFEKEFGVALKMRIGLHTGLVNVGNFGSRNRFNYTMIGDAANLASRLEGANKAFGTDILASAHTVQQLPREMARRKVADIIVVGKTNATSVYEPLTTERIASEEGRITTFNEGLTLFEAGELARAKEIFAKLPNDSVAQRYIERIIGELKGSFQKEQWTAAWCLSEK